MFMVCFVLDKVYSVISVTGFSVAVTVNGFDLFPLPLM